METAEVLDRALRRALRGRPCRCVAHL